ncbi:MAG: copper ion binding protein, partial [Chitinophagales bacterium]
MLLRKTIKLSGMSCAACAARIEKGLSRLEGVASANVNFAIEKAVIEYDDSLARPQQFTEVVKRLGYDVIEEPREDVVQANLQISGMSCAACSARIEKRLNSLDGVKSARVNLATEKAVIAYEPHQIEVGELIEAIQKLGYDATRSEKVSREGHYDEKEQETRSLRLLLVCSAILSTPLLTAMFLDVFKIHISTLA